MLRYEKQVLLKKIGKKQNLLRKKTVAIVGCGALGSVAAELLARAGVGKLVLIDRDVVELSNLQRQSLYTEKDIGEPKAIAAHKHLKEINTEIKIQPFVRDISAHLGALKKVNLIVDGTDNLRTRLLINDYARKNNVPWIYGAVIADQGRVMNLLPHKDYCFHCVFHEAQGLETCDTAGILNTAVHAVAALQVTEALKILTHQKPLEGLFVLDVWKAMIEKFSVKKRKDCETCNKNYLFLQSKEEAVVSFCGSNQYQIIGNFDSRRLKKKLKKIGKIIETPYYFKWGNLVIFKNRVIIKAKSKEDAKIVYAKYIGN